jgi:multidrug efflux pump subunit AcrA (membrane-fusion protein)
MKKSSMAWLLAVSILIVGIVISRVLSNQKKPMHRSPFISNSKPLKIIPVQYQDISSEIVMTGPLSAYDKIELYAEVSGVLMESQPRLKEGVRFKKGDVLLRMDDRVYRNTVLSQKSSLLNQITLLLPDLSIDFPESAKHWEAYLKTLQLEKSMAPLPEPSSEQERYYIASRNIYTQYYSVKGMEETLAKYALYAPFDGVVIQANINPGTLVRIGQKLGEFTNTELLEMEAAVGIREAKRLRIGQKVKLISEVIPGEFSGTIQRINPVIDRSTMTVKIYIHIRDSRLTDGMYLTARVQANPIRQTMSVQKDLLVGDNQLFTVEDSVLVLKSIEIITEEGDQLFIRGLEEGTLILAEVWTEARDGARIPKPSSPPDPSAQSGDTSFEQIQNSVKETGS